MDEHFGLDPFGGLEDEVGNVCLDADPGAIVGSLEDEALVLIVARILPLGHDLDAVADLEGFCAAAGDGLLHGGSLRLVLPVEDLDAACGDAETVDGFLIPSAFVRGGTFGPIVDALLFSGDDGSFQIDGLDGCDMDSAGAAGFLTEYGEGCIRSVHERR